MVCVCVQSPLPLPHPLPLRPRCRQQLSRGFRALVVALPRPLGPRAGPPWATCLPAPHLHACHEARALLGMRLAARARLPSPAAHTQCHALNALGSTIHMHACMHAVIAIHMLLLAPRLIADGHPRLRLLQLLRLGLQPTAAPLASATPPSRQGRRRARRKPGRNRPPPPTLNQASRVAPPKRSHALRMLLPLPPALSRGTSPPAPSPYKAPAGRSGTPAPAARSRDGRSRPHRMHHCVGRRGT